MREEGLPSDESPDRQKDLIGLIYDDLHGFVCRHLARSTSKTPTLQPTDIAHDACLRLLSLDRTWASEAELRSVAARAVRSVLVDYARRRNARKRDRGRRPLPLLEGQALSADAPLDVLDLNAALEKLQARRPQQAKVVVLRFFGCMTFSQVGEALKIAEDTAKGYWKYARAFLRRELGGDDDSFVGVLR